MAGTMANYLVEERRSLAEHPLTDVDSLVLTTISYLYFEHGYLAGAGQGERVPLPMAICGISHQDLFGDIWLATMGGPEFYTALLQSPRFMGLSLGRYVNEVASDAEKQFSAVTFYLPDGSAYVAYRGTDNSLAGWKEDFNITFMSEVPSQARARAYLEELGAMCVSRIYVGGHSKGGNLAEYAVLTCDDVTYDKVARVFSHDGPAFAFKPSGRIDTPGYAERLSKTVPGSSVFGMLMEDRTCYRIVRSSGVLFLQHAATHWEVEAGDFVTLDELSPEATVVGSTLNNWARSYDPQQRMLFIDTVFGLLGAADADTWADFGKDRATSTLAVLEATAKLPADMRDVVFGMLRDLAPLLRSAAAEEARRVRDALPKAPEPLAGLAALSRGKDG